MDRIEGAPDGEVAVDGRGPGISFDIDGSGEPLLGAAVAQKGPVAPVSHGHPVVGARDESGIRWFLGGGAGERGVAIQLASRIVGAERF